MVSEYEKENILIDGVPADIEQYVEFLNSLNDNTDDYLFLWEINNNRFWYSGLISENYELQDKGLPYCSPDEVMKVVYTNDREMLSEDLNKIIIGESCVHNLEYRWVNRNGDNVWISCRGTVKCDENGKPYIMVGRVSDTVLMNKVDVTTGMFNKIRMFETLQRIFTENPKGYLMVLGVDNLKDINIRFGRHYGNEIIKNIARVLEDIIGNSQQIFKLDGDCFAIHLLVDNEKDVEEIYNEIQENVIEICTVSAGAVSFESQLIDDGNVAYQYAEDALDKAKKLGKNQLVFFSEDDFHKKVSELELLEEFKTSIANGCEGFYLNYQPQVKSRNHELFGAEALLRYTSPTRGRIFPDQFIPMLEQTGLICPVGLWVLETALKDCKEWRKKIPDFHISVNVSYVQLKQENIAEKVLEVLKESGLPGEVLTLEVTESMQLQDFIYYNKIFYKWKKAGIEISVDDFGTGYSSLAYLKSLKIDEIKIDRCFVSGIQYSTYNYRLISNMLELAKDSQIRVCCEGVEVEEEMRVLENLKTNIMQGYLFAKPCDREQFLELYVKDDVPEYNKRIARIEDEDGNDILQEHLPTITDSMEAIMNAMDDIIFISDLDTHELYYLNQAGCSLTGVYDYEGKKCYDVLQGYKATCDFCDGDNLSEDKFVLWRLNNESLNRHYIIKDKIIMWRGKKARLEIAMDITEYDIVDIKEEIC